MVVVTKVVRQAVQSASESRRSLESEEFEIRSHFPLLGVACEEFLKVERALRQAENNPFNQATRDDVLEAIRALQPRLVEVQPDFEQRLEKFELRASSLVVAITELAGAGGPGHAIHAARHLTNYNPPLSDVPARLSYGAIRHYLDFTQRANSGVVESIFTPEPYPIAIYSPPSYSDYSQTLRALSHIIATLPPDAPFRVQAQGRCLGLRSERIVESFSGYFLASIPDSPQDIRYERRSASDQGPLVAPGSEDLVWRAFNRFEGDITALRQILEQRGNGKISEVVNDHIEKVLVGLKDATAAVRRSLYIASHLGPEYYGQVRALVALIPTTKYQFIPEYLHSRAPEDFATLDRICDIRERRIERGLRDNDLTSFELGAVRDCAPFLFPSDWSWVIRELRRYPDTQLAHDPEIRGLVYAIEGQALKNLGPKIGISLLYGDRILN